MATFGQFEEHPLPAHGDVLLPVDFAHSLLHTVHVRVELVPGLPFLVQLEGERTASRSKEIDAFRTETLRHVALPVVHLL